MRMTGDEVAMTGYKNRIGNREISIGISTMPNLKKPCLVVQEGNCITKYASFNNIYAAHEFMDIFADFMGVERHEWFE